MQIKQGFTLSQTLFVLFMISIILLLVPNIMRRTSGLNFEVHRVKDTLLKRQANALFDKTTETIVIRDNVLTTSVDTTKLAKGINCGQHKIQFNERGNVNMARTITCSYGASERSVVVHIGNGNIYVK